MDRRFDEGEDHSLFNQTTEVGITLTGDQARLLHESLNQATLMQADPLNATAAVVDLHDDGVTSPTVEEEGLADTEIDPLQPRQTIVQLDRDRFESRFLEIKRHVLGFHSLLEKGYETLITVAGFPEFPEIRLRSISIYPSGSLYVEGENRNGEWVSIFSHLDTINYALTKQRSTQRKKSVQEIEFNIL